MLSGASVSDALCEGPSCLIGEPPKAVCVLCAAGHHFELQWSSALGREGMQLQMLTGTVLHFCFDAQLVFVVLCRRSSVSIRASSALPPRCLRQAGD